MISQLLQALTRKGGEKAISAAKSLIPQPRPSQSSPAPSLSQIVQSLGPQGFSQPRPQQTPQQPLPQMRVQPPTPPIQKQPMMQQQASPLAQAVQGLGLYGDTSLRAPSQTLRAPVPSDRTSRSDSVNLANRAVSASQGLLSSINDFFQKGSEFQRTRVAEQGPVKGTALGLADLASGAVGGLYNQARRGMLNLEDLASSEFERQTRGVVPAPRLAERTIGQLPEFQASNPFQQMFQAAGEAGIYAAPSAAISSRAAHLGRGARAGMSAGGDVALDLATQGELTPLGAGAAGIGGSIEALTPPRLRGLARGASELTEQLPATRGALSQMPETPQQAARALPDEAPATPMARQVDDLPTQPTPRDLPEAAPQEVPTMTRADQFIRGTEDITQPIRRFEETVPSRLEVDPSGEKSLAVSRARAQSGAAEDWARNIVDEISSAAKQFDKDIPTMSKLVNDFAIARTTRERAARGVGTPEEIARTNKILNDFEKLPKKMQAEIKKLQTQLVDFSAQTLKLLRDNKLLSPERFKELRDNFPEHVNLYRQLLDETTPSQYRSVGIKGSGLKQAKGSDLEVDRVIDNILQARLAVITRVEQNKVLRSLADRSDELTKQFPDQQMVRVTNPKQSTDLFSNQKIEEMRRLNQLPFVDENGVQRILQLDNDTMLAFSTLRNADLDLGQSVLAQAIRKVGALTKGFSQLFTRFNVPFLTNQNVMDLSEGMSLVLAKGDTKVSSMVKMPPRQVAATKAVFDYLRGADTPGAKAYKEFVDLGGSSGSPALGSKDQVAKTINQLLSEKESVVKKGINGIVRQLDNYGEIMDNATRFNLYQTGLEQGLTKKQAALYSKRNSGVDFDVSGSWGPAVNTFIMFGNVALKSNTRMFRHIYAKPKAFAKVFGGMYMLNEARNAWNDMVDPEWRTKVSEWDNDNGFPLVIPTKDGDTLYIPFRVGWGLRPIKYMVEAPNKIAQGAMDPRDAAFGISNSFLESFNVLGGEDFSLLDSTLAGPMSQVRENRNFMGNQIRPTFGNDPYFPSLADDFIGKFSIGVHNGIENVIGRPLGDMNPLSAANLTHLIRGYGAAPLRQAEGVFKYFSDLLEGDLKSPGFGGVTKRRTEDQYTSSNDPRIKKIVADEKFGLTKLRREETKNIKEAVEIGLKHTLGEPVDTSRANQIIDSLSDAAYKKFEEEYKTSLADKIIELGKSDPSQANQIIDSLSDAEYQAFEKQYALSQLSREEKRLSNLSLQERAKVLLRMRDEAEGDRQKEKEYDEMYDRLKEAGVISSNLEKIMKDMLFNL
jgi:hypothetical protein